MPQTVTISSSFGAGGNVVGPAVAEHLGIPFFDRAIPTTVASRLAITIEDATAQDEKAPPAWARLSRAFANMAVPMSAQDLGSPGDPDQFRSETERILHQIADSTGGVVLGRGAMVVLGNQPGVLRVRLDGDVDARIARVAEIEKIDLDAARVMQRDTDGARDHYMRLFYRVRQDDFTLYDLMIDTTEIPFDTCTELIVLAAKAKSAAG